LTRGSEIDVTGKAAESNWYRFKMDDGATGFVFGKYLAPEAPRKKDRVVQPTTEPNSSVTSSSGNRGSVSSGQINVVNASRLELSSSSSQLIKDIARRSFSGSEWAKVDRLTVRLSNVGTRTESNPDYVGAKIAQGVFGAFLGRGIQFGNVPETISLYSAHATVIAALKDGSSWTDAATYEVKGTGRANSAKKMMETVMNAVSQAANRVIVRMSGGAPPVASSGLKLGSAPRTSNNTATSWPNPDDQNR
jgi:hypothetical protein